MSLARLTARLAAFRDDTRGNVTLEFLLVFPLIAWAFAAVFVFFDGYRQSSVNLKAAYTISDLISRETGEVDDEYIDSMHSLLQTLTRAASPTMLRVTIIRWDKEDNRYYVDWSANRGYLTGLDDDSVVTLKDRLPTMPDGERVILVETNNTFQPSLKVGIGDIDLENFVFTRPRFAPQICGFGMPCSGEFS